MKKIIILFVLLISINLTAQQVVEKVFSFGWRNDVSDLTKLEDGNLLMIANSSLYLFLDINGDSISSAIIGDSPTGVVQIDSFYFESGWASPSGGSLTKRNQDFNFVLGREFGAMGTASASVGRINKTISNNVLLNYILYHESGNTYYYLGKYNTDLGQLWRIPASKIFSYIEYIDESVLISSLGSSSKIRLLRIDSVGNTIYSSIFGSCNQTSQIQTFYYDDNAFLLCREDPNNGTENHLELYKVDVESGAPLWTKSYFHGYNAKITSSCKGYENNMIVTGTCKKDNAMTAFIFTFNSNGDSISTMFIDSYTPLVPIKIISSEGYFYLVGNIYEGGHSKDIYFLKAPLDTTYISNINVPTEKYNYFNAYPNPAKNNLWVTTNSTTSNKRQLIATSINGTHIYTIDLNTSINNNQIDISKWSDGIYILGLYENGLMKTKKIVILK